MSLVFILLIIFIGISLYLIDFKIGSSTSTYNSEIGIPASCCKRVKFTGNEFFGEVLPFQLVSIGLPLLAYDVASGAVLIILSLILILWMAKGHLKTV
jgi:hypothetical protein